MINHKRPSPNAYIAKKAKKLKKEALNASLLRNHIMYRVNNLKNQHTELKSTENELFQISDTPEFLPPLFCDFLNTLLKNSDVPAKQRRYDSIHDFLTLIGIYGKKVVEILHFAIGLPSYRTIQTYRKQLERELDITDDIFNGSFKSIQNLMTLNSIHPGSKVTLMIDACYVEPYISVDSNGTVSGFINTTKIELDDATQCIQNEENFMVFLNNHNSEVIKSEFVFMLSTIDGKVPMLPIFCRPMASGAANSSIINDIDTICESLNQLGIKVVGIGTDGDRQYVKYYTNVTNTIYDNFDYFLVEEYTKFKQNFIATLHFSDPLHLVKRDRYNKIKPGYYYPGPCPDNNLVSLTMYRESGIPEYLLDDSPAKKMDDSIAWRFFSADMMTRLKDANNIPLLISFLPSHLMIDSIISKSYSRVERIDRLLLGLNIVMIFYICVKIEQFSKSTNKTHRGHYAKGRRAFNISWMEEYISTCFGIVDLLLNENELNLGACGTHPLEHLFGNIKRISNGKETHKDFMKSMKSMLLINVLKERCGLGNLNLITRKDSGAMVTEPLINDNIYAINWFYKALSVLNICYLIPNDRDYFESYYTNEIMSEDDFESLYEEKNKKSNCFISTKNKSIITTGGLANVRRWKATNQINRFTMDK